MVSGSPVTESEYHAGQGACVFQRVEEIPNLGGTVDKELFALSKCYRLLGAFLVYQ